VTGECAVLCCVVCCDFNGGKVNCVLKFQDLVEVYFLFLSFC
jgi:hypothetical protein